MERVSKYRVDDDWINCEMAYLKKRMKFDDSDAVLTTETSVPILFAMLEEIKERRESDKSGGVTMERVSDKWLDDAIPKYSIIDSKSKGANVYLALCELRERRQNEIKSQHEIEKLKTGGQTMRLNDETMLVLAEALQNECLDRDCEYCKFEDGVDCMFENRPMYYELPDTAAEAERTRQMKQKAGKEHEHTDHSTSEKDGAGATQERENEIDVFWYKIAMQYHHCPCVLSLCPALDGDKCGFWDGTCAASLRKKYESIAGIPQKNAKETVLPTPVKQVDGVSVDERNRERNRL